MNDRNILFTFDKSYHIAYDQEYFCCSGSSAVLYNRENGDLVAKLNGVKQPSCSVFTSDRRLVIKTTKGHYHVFDLDSKQQIKKIPPPKDVLGSVTEFRLTSDNRYIIDFACLFPTVKLMAVEIDTGSYTFFDIGFARTGCILSTEDENRYFVVTDCADTEDADDVSRRDFFELLYSNGSYTLKKAFTGECGYLTHVDYGCGRFVSAIKDKKIAMFDGTGTVWGNLDFSSAGVLYDMKLSQSGRLVAIVHSEDVCVYDLDSKCCVDRFVVDYGCFASFIDDTKLLIGTWKKGYCVSLAGF